jgi:hypothetical protein
MRYDAMRCNGFITSHEYHMNISLPPHYMMVPNALGECRHPADAPHALHLFTSFNIIKREKFTLK